MSLPPATDPSSRDGSQRLQRIDRFLKLAVDRGSSDLHISTGLAPILRIAGKLETLRYRVIDHRDFIGLIEPVTPPALWKKFQATGDLDFAYQVPGVARFRVNLFQQQRGPGASFRLIPSKIMTLEELGLPGELSRFAHLRSGLALITGPTGSGKSTTLAAIIHEMNRLHHRHIITIEDPIEFVHENQRSLISQRQVGTHTPSFAKALHMALREDPDVILVGEMRDVETIEIALRAADAGLLVFGTLHTNSAAKAIDRITSVFPAQRADECRNLLSAVVSGIVAQQLLARKSGGRIAAIELLFATPALRSVIREGKSHQIVDIINTGGREGMVSLDARLRELTEKGEIEPIHGLEKASDKEAMKRWLREEGFELPRDVDESEAEAGAEGGQ